MRKAKSKTCEKKRERSETQDKKRGAKCVSGARGAKREKCNKSGMREAKRKTYEKRRERSARGKT